ncbi:MAG: hypothetical protein ACYTBZ_27405, partial [Planctomycetota bacterium]
SSLDTTFSIGSGSAEVHCDVYKYTSGTYADKYVYAYQISNIDSEVGLSYFSVGILDGANAFDPDCEPQIDVIVPDFWTAVGSPAQSVDALFTNPLHSDTASTVLWFVSDYASTLGSGALCGTASGIPHASTGDLLTPVPEPATIVLLGTCGLLTLVWKMQSV